MDVNDVLMQGKLTNVKSIWQGEEEAFYKGILEVLRESGTMDKVPIIVSGNLLKEVNCEDVVVVRGQIRSKDTTENDKLKVEMFVCVKEINNPTKVCEIESKNVAKIDGYICKKPTLRTTPSGKQIADVLIACNYGKNKTSYISSIVWGKNARTISKLKVGDYVKTQGKFQSRSYTKIIDDVKYEKVAYELSIDTLNVQ